MYDRMRKWLPGRVRTAHRCDLKQHRGGHCPPYKLVTIGLLFLTTILPLVTEAHHVLGRPAYSLNEDSNTPPSMQVETQIGDYFVNYMVFPAFPRPGEPGRINLYVTRLDDDTPFTGKVTFKIRDDSWFGGNEEILGEQMPDDNVYRQGYQFKEAGDYIITAQFEAGGEPYVIDFPLRVGNPPPVGPLGLAFGVIVALLIGVSLIQRKRLQRLKISQSHEGQAE